MKKIIVYAIIIVILGFTFRVVDGIHIDTLNPGIGQLLWLISPLLIALIFHFVLKQKSDWGLAPRFKASWPWYFVAFLLFPIIFFLLTILGISIGSIEKLKPIWTIGFMTMLFAAVPTLFVKNIFEEFVWRGFLLSQLEKQKISWLKNHFIVGIIWAVWHLPYIDGFAQGYHDMSWQIYVPLFLIGAVVTAFTYGEIVRRSGTVWTAVILHTMGNAFVNILFFEQHIQLNAGKEWWLSPAIDNLGYIVVMSILGYFLIGKVKGGKSVFG